MTGPPFPWEKKYILQFNLRTFSNIKNTSKNNHTFFYLSLPIFPKVYSKLERSLDILPLKCGSFKRKGKIALSIENPAVGHCYVLQNFKHQFANSQHCALTTICLYWVKHIGNQPVWYYNGLELPCTQLCPLWTRCWLTGGLHIGLTIPSLKPKQCWSGHRNQIQDLCTCNERNKIETKRKKNPNNRTKRKMHEF